MVEDLSETLLEFIHASIPTFQATEALLFLAAKRDRDFSPDEIVVSMAATSDRCCHRQRVCRVLFAAQRLTD